MFREIPEKKFKNNQQETMVTMKTILLNDQLIQAAVGGTVIGITRKSV
jgi:hypothetical protein